RHGGDRAPLPERANRTSCLVLLEPEEPDDLLPALEQVLLHRALGRPEDASALGDGPRDGGDRECRDPPTHPDARIVEPPDPVPTAVGNEERLLSEVLGAR